MGVFLCLCLFNLDQLSDVTGQHIQSGDIQLPIIKTGLGDVATNHERILDPCKYKMLQSFDKFISRTFEKSPPLLTRETWPEHFTES